MTIADRKEREFKRREGEILNAAFQLFAERGLEAVTIEMIAEAAEIGKGTIYKHFTSKHDIFASLALRRGEEMLQRMNAEIDPEAPVLQQIRQLIRLVWEKFIEDQRGYYILKKCEDVLATEELSPEVAKKLQCKHDMVHSAANAVIARATAEGLMAEAPADHLFIVGYGAIMGVIELMNCQPVEDKERLYQLMENMVIKGLMRY